MNKSIVLTEEKIQSMINEAVVRGVETLNDEAISIAGCDIKCILIYEGNARNNGKEMLPLKLYCNYNHLNHRVVFNVLRDLGWIKYLDDEKKNCSILTELGFIEINGTDPQSSPVMTTSNSTMYVNDKDERFEKFIETIKKHSMFLEDNNGYNTNIKESNHNFSIHELKIAKKLGVEIIEAKEITDETQDD